MNIQTNGPYHAQMLQELIRVACRITPWNISLIFSWKIGDAIICGYSIVLKTTEQTPLSTLYVEYIL